MHHSTYASLDSVKLHIAELQTSGGHLTLRLLAMKLVVMGPPPIRNSRPINTTVDGAQILTFGQTLHADMQVG